MKNSNLHSAKRVKNDEFYTRLTDIEKEIHQHTEMGPYRLDGPNIVENPFRGKTVFLNCDDPAGREDVESEDADEAPVGAVPFQSEFWRYFSLNFDHFGIKRLISTHYEDSRPSYRLDKTTYRGKGRKTRLKQNGDFRSPECLEILKQSDIVVTNPPFSLFREYVEQLITYDKKFLIIGNMNAITYKEVFKHIQDNRLWLGYTYPKEFLQPDGSIKKFGNICWFTNLPTRKRMDEIIVYKRYKGNEHLYPKYDNYDAINVDKVTDIPGDYTGVMGVPITFLDKYNPEQFRLCGNVGSYSPDGYSKATAVYINGRKVFKRLLIRNLKPEGV